MSKQIELERLDRSIKNDEIRIHTVKANIDLLSREIAILTDLEISLEQNIQCLKAQKTIAIATEFKKAKEDLAKAKGRMIGLRNDREHFRKAQALAEKTIAEAKEQIEKINKDGDTNVLYVNFWNKENG